MTSTPLPLGYRRRASTRPNPRPLRVKVPRAPFDDQHRAKIGERASPNVALIWTKPCPGSRARSVSGALAAAFRAVADETTAARPPRVNGVEHACTGLVRRRPVREPGHERGRRAVPRSVPRPGVGPPHAHPVHAPGEAPVRRPPSRRDGAPGHRRVGRRRRGPHVRAGHDLASRPRSALRRHPRLHREPALHTHRASSGRNALRARSRMQSRRVHPVGHVLEPARRRGLAVGPNSEIRIHKSASLVAIFAAAPAARRCRASLAGCRARARSRRR